MKQMLFEEVGNESEYRHISLREDESGVIKLSTESFDAFVSVVLKKFLLLPGVNAQLVDWHYGVTYQITFSEGWTYKTIKAVLTNYNAVVEVENPPDKISMIDFLPVFDDES